MSPNVVMASTAIDEQERMKILRDIKAIIGRDTEPSETETKNLNTTNDTVLTTDESFETNESIKDTEMEASEEEQEGTNKRDANTATTNEEGRNKMVTETITEKKNDTIVEIEREHTIGKTEEEREKKNDDGVQHDCYDKTEKRNSCKIIEQMHTKLDMIMQMYMQMHEKQEGTDEGDGCEETEGRKRETVDTGETDPSTGSKRSDYQHQQESTNTEKGPTLMTECMD